MDTGRSHWNNGVNGTVLISIVVSNMVLIVRDKILWWDSYYYLHSYVESYVGQRLIPSKQYV